MGQIKLYAVYAIAAVLAVVVALTALIRFNPQGPWEPTPNYDIVVKYCFSQPPAQASGNFSRDLFETVQNLEMGSYMLSGGGRLYIYDAGMFEMFLPPDRRQAKRVGFNLKLTGEQKKPMSVIGCTRSQLLAVLSTYEVRPVAHFDSTLAIPPPLEAQK